MTKPRRKISTRKVKKKTRKTMKSGTTYIKYTKKRIHNQEREYNNSYNNSYENVLHSLTNSSKDNRTHISNVILSNLSKKNGKHKNNNYRYFSEGVTV